MSERAVNRLAGVRIALFTCLLALGVFLPLSALEGAPLCIFLLSSGRPCPGCGMTRAFFSVMKGRIGAAFAFNPVFTALYFPIMLILFGNDLYCFIRRVILKRGGESFLDGIFTGRLFESFFGKSDVR